MGLTIAAIIIILMAILAPIIHHKKYSKDAEGTVYLHLFVTVIFSVISGVVAIVGLFISIFAKDSFVPCMIILSLSFILTLVSLSTAIWHITYDKDGIVRVNLFGVKRKFAYKDITEYKKDMGDVTIYAGKRRICIDAYTCGREKLLSAVKKEYRALNKGVSLRERPKRKDIFNGNLNRPGEFIFVFVVFSAFAVAAIVFGLIVFFSGNEGEISYKEVSFDSYEINDDNMFLYEKETSEKYIVYNYEMRGDLCDKFESGFNSQNVYIIGAEDKEENDVAYSVKAIKIKGGEEIYSYEQYLRDEQKNKTLALVFAFILALFIIFFIVMSVIIARNPHKFSPKIIHLFFKKGYINY